MRHRPIGAMRACGTLRNNGYEVMLPWMSRGHRIAMLDGWPNAAEKTL